MVDLTNLGHVNALVAEKNSINAALADFDSPEGHIDGFRIAPSDAIINTEGWPYPAQMVEGIKQMLHQRLTAIESELSGLGVGGIQPQARARRR